MWIKAFLHSINRGDCKKLSVTYLGDPQRKKQTNKKTHWSWCCSDYLWHPPLALTSSLLRSHLPWQVSHGDGKSLLRKPPSSISSFSLSQPLRSFTTLPVPTLPRLQGRAAGNVTSCREGQRRVQTGVVWCVTVLIWLVSRRTEHDSQPHVNAPLVCSLWRASASCGWRHNFSLTDLLSGQCCTYSFFFHKM